ncbi:D-2-hydroxyacid dehydrogenase [Chloroflexota bacterium]
MMEKYQVMLSVPLQESDIQAIEATAPDVTIIYAMEEVRTELGISRTGMPSLLHSARQSEISQEQASKALDSILADTDMIFGWRLPNNLLARAPKLKWVQGSGVGIDLLVASTGLMESDVIITNAGGINASQVAEAALGFIFMIAKKTAMLYENMNAAIWKPMYFAELKGATLGIVGLGKVGGELAKYSRTLGMTVYSSTKLDENVSGVDRVYAPDDLHKMLPECDYVVLTVPQTPETIGLIGETALKRMKPEAYLINVARGGVVQEDVLIRALKEGWIAGAALDVFEKEPLPPDSELWRLPNVIISPHIAGILENHMTAATGLFCDNLKRFIQGEQLINIFNKARGY